MHKKYTMEQLKQRAQRFHQKRTLHYGKIIRRYREIQGMTRDELAELMDYSTKGWEKIETGKNQVSLELLEKASYVLGFSVLYEAGHVIFSHTEDQSRSLIHQFLTDWQRQLDGLKSNAISLKQLKRMFQEILIEKYLGEGEEFIFAYRSDRLSPLIQEVHQHQQIDAQTAEDWVRSELSSEVEVSLERLKWALKTPASMSCFDLEFDLEDYVFNLYLTFDFEEEKQAKRCLLEALDRLPLTTRQSTHRLRDWSWELLKDEVVLQKILISNLKLVAIFNS